MNHWQSQCHPKRECLNDVSAEYYRATGHHCRPVLGDWCHGHIGWMSLFFGPGCDVRIPDSVAVSRGERVQVPITVLNYCYWPSLMASEELKPIAAVVILDTEASDRRIIKCSFRNVAATRWQSDFLIISEEPILDLSRSAAVEFKFTLNGTVDRMETIRLVVSGEDNLPSSTIAIPSAGASE